MKLRDFKSIFSFELRSINNWSCNQNSFGYKPFKLSNTIKFRKILHNYKEDLIKIITIIRTKSNYVFNGQPSDIVFVLEYSNHLSIYKKLTPFLNNLNISHSPLFINDINENKNNFNELAFQYFDFEYFFRKLQTNFYLIISSSNYIGIIEKMLFNSKMFLLSCQYFKAADLIKELYKPKLAIFFRVEGIKNRSITLGLKHHSINTICIQHGSIINHPLFSNILVDEFITWGEIFSNYIIQSGSTCIRTAIGSVDYDELFLRAKKNIGLKLGPKIKILLLPPSGISFSLGSDKDLMLELANSIDKNKYQITFKPHPGDIGLENEIIANKSGFDYLHSNDLLFFENFDIVVINNSSAGLEASIFGKPLILVAEKLENIVVKHYLIEEIGLFASNEITFQDALNKIESEYFIFQDNCKKFTNRYLSNHGNATQKLADYLSTKVCVA